jgi:telomerase protein component 1
MSGYVSTEITDPRLRLTNRVCSSLLKENTHGESSQDKTNHILADLNEVKKLDPEYIGQLAFYSRQVLGIRKTANFLLAYLASHPETQPFLPQYFMITAKSPLDLLDVLEMAQTCRGPREFDGHYHVPFPLKVAIQEKFAEFDTAVLAKYCSDGRRKRVLRKLKDKKQKHQNPIFKLCMKQLVRLCHIKRPADHVMAILGKKYPSTYEAFQRSLLNERTTFDPEKIGTRMKLPIASSIEVLISMQGNTAATWETIIKNDWLPLKDLLKNVKNIMEAKVDEEATQLVLGKLTDLNSYKKNKFFPIKFYSAYEAVLEGANLQIRQEELESIKVRETPQSPFLDWLAKMFNVARPIVTRMRPATKSATYKNKTPKSKLANPEVAFQYISALEAAVKLSISMNVSKLLGHSVILCDVSGSMRSPIATARNIGSARTFIEVGITLGLMMKHVCESCEFIIFSSPKGGSAGSQWSWRVRTS